MIWFYRLVDDVNWTHKVVALQKCTLGNKNYLMHVIFQFTIKETDHKFKHTYQEKHTLLV